MHETRLLLWNRKLGFKRAMFRAVASEQEEQKYREKEAWPCGGFFNVKQKKGLLGK